MATPGRERSERWAELEALVDRLLDAPDEGREALIEELSAGDPARRSFLESLLADCVHEPELLRAPAAERFAALFDEAGETRFPDALRERYRLTRELARGGMGTVYLAHDTKHGRDVAVKVVHRAFSSTLGRDRFLREIGIAARLRHPHIVPLFDSGETDGTLYYVMPYEPGLSLRQRLERDGPLPAREVVQILRELCDALAYAHGHGIVHRDIKPDNVLLSGRHATISDFGIARAASDAALVRSTAAESDAPSTVTATGAALGTPAYMAPEQIAGDPNVDHRADLYSLGALAYELLAGVAPFTGATRAEVLSANLKREPAPLAALRPDVPAALCDLVMRCLAKRPDDRWGSAAEVLQELDRLTPERDAAALAAPAGRRLTRTVAWTTGAGAVLLVAAVFAGAAWRTSHGRAVPVAAVGRASQLTFERGLEVQPSISPDGRSVAYAAGNSLRARIAVRPVHGGRPRWLATDSANQWLPQWSPDGERVLFLSRGGVFSAPAQGEGPEREEVPSAPGAIVRSAAWSPDGREIAYVRRDSLLARAVGSSATRLVTTGADLHSCRWSPGGAWLACVSGNSFYVTVGAVSGVGPMFGNLAPSRIVLVPASGGAAVDVTDGTSLNQSPVWSRDGRTLYYVSNREGPRDVFAVDVHDLGARIRSIAGREPSRITTGLGAQSIDLSADGTRLVYAVYSSTANVWAIAIPQRPRATPLAATSASATPVTSGNQTVEGVRVSADDRWLVYDSDLSGNSDVYRVPLAGGEPERLTHGPADEFRGVLSPDGRELAYHSFQTGSRNIFVLTLDDGAVHQLTRSPGQLAMPNWSPDGTALAFFDMVGTRVMVMRRNARGDWSAPRFTGGRGWRAEWSPDGRTIAFVSPTDGRIALVPADSGAPRDVYVPGKGEPLAELAVFAANGRELYFKSHDSRGRASFWTVGVAGGRPRPLVVFDDSSWPSNRFDFAVDSGRFYFTVEDRQSDLWVADFAGR